MRTALVVRHVHFEDLGAFAAPLRDARYQSRYVEIGGDTLRLDAARDADLLVILGGPVGAYERESYPFLGDEVELLAARLAAGAPTLGVCLGAQLMATALGAEVRRGTEKEIGWAPVTLTEAGRRSPLRHFEGFRVLHWHGDVFDLPADSVGLASTPACPNQAFAIGRHALGFQFHPEADGEGFENWLIGHAAEIAAAGLPVSSLRDDAQRFGRQAGNAGRQCLAEWLEQLP